MPRDHKLGHAIHGMIGAFYFYEQDSQDDPAFGFFDIELSVQSIAANSIRVEIYCVADGYQTSRGIGTNNPLRLCVMAGDKVVGSTEWRFADVICGHADPMNFSADVTIASGTFADINSIAIDKVEGLSGPCRGS